MSVLILAPHPDDEILGCGGTIAKHVNDSLPVHVLVVTRGSAKIWSSTQIDQFRAECRAANQLLGVSSVEFLEFEAPELDRYPIAEISKAIKSHLDKLMPHTIYVPHHGDIHHDHGIVTQAALVAARPIRNCPVKTIYAYETLSETEWAIPSALTAFVPNFFVDITTQLPAKVSAMRCYASQLQQYPHPRSIEAIESLARVRGSTIGCNAAEAFQLLRQIA